MTSEGKVLKEGWGTKCGGFWKTWHKRWFVLSDNILEYSKQPGVIPQGSIDLSEAIEITESPECKKQPALRIVCQERTYYIVTDTQQEIDEWIEALNKAKMSNHPDKKPTIASYKIVRFIGSGLHSSVLEVQNINDGKRYAAKRYSNKLIEDKSEQLEKIKTLVGVKLPYVCPLVDVFQDDESTLLIFEKFPYSLQDITRNKPNLPLLAISIFAEICSGLRVLHDKGFTYGDFHPSNVLLSETGHVSLAIPGFIFPVDENQERYLQYLSKDALEQKSPSKRSDLWGVTIILYKLFTGFVPFLSTSVSALKEEIKKDIFFPSLIPSELLEKLKNWLCFDSNGPSYNDIVTEIPKFETPSLIVDYFPKETEATKVDDNIDFSHENPLVSFTNGSLLFDPK